MEREEDSYLVNENITSKKGWKLLAFWTVAVLITSSFLSLSVYVERNGEFKSVSALLSYIFGSVCGLPLIVLGLSQRKEKYRNARSRIKAMLYTSCLVLFSQIMVFLHVFSAILKEAVCGCS